MDSQYHIIENHNRTFTVMYGRAIVSTHRSRKAAEDKIVLLEKRRRLTQL